MNLDEYARHLAAQREQYNQPKVTRIIKHANKKASKPKLKPKTFKP